MTNPENPHDRKETTSVPKKRPSLAQVKQWVSDGIAEATDGCRVEPDGVCEHGHKSWLIELGYI